MLQRIQTLFLLLAFLSLMVVGFFPILRFGSGNPSILSSKEILAFKSKGQIASSSLSSSSKNITANQETYQIPNLLVWISAGILIVFSIFLFGSRILQMRIIWACIGLILILSVLIYLDINHLGDPTAPRNLEPGAYALSASLLFLLMARRQIQKDENLVRSVDRLR